MSKLEESLQVSRPLARIILHNLGVELTVGKNTAVLKITYSTMPAFDYVFLEVIKNYRVEPSPHFRL